MTTMSLSPERAARPTYYRYCKYHKHAYVTRQKRGDCPMCVRERKDEAAEAERARNRAVIRRERPLEGFARIIISSPEDDMPLGNDLPICGLAESVEAGYFSYLLMLLFNGVYMHIVTDMKGEHPSLAKFELLPNANVERGQVDQFTKFVPTMG